MADILASQKAVDELETKLKEIERRLSNLSAQLNNRVDLILTRVKAVESIDFTPEFDTMRSKLQSMASAQHNNGAQTDAKIDGVKRSASSLLGRVRNLENADKSQIELAMQKMTTFSAMINRFETTLAKMEKDMPKNVDSRIDKLRSSIEELEASLLASVEQRISEMERVGQDVYAEFRRIKKAVENNG